MKYALLFVFCLGIAGNAMAQDSTGAVAKSKVPLRFFSFSDPHNPTKASLYSALIPGLGQLYNQKYWKLPIIYAGIGTAVWYMRKERSIMRDSNASFRALYSMGKSPTTYAIAKRDDARKHRDFSILAISAIYVLQIVDATVDAHFYHLNIDQNLEANFQTSPSRFLSFTYRF